MKGYPFGSYSLIHFFLFLLLFVSPALGEDIEPPQKADVKPAHALSLIEIYRWTNTLPQELIDLQRDIESASDLSGMQKQLPEISKQLEEMTWQSTSLQSNPNLTYYELTSFESQLEKIKRKIAIISAPIEAHIGDLETWYKDWLAKEEKLQEVQEEIQTVNSLQSAIPAVESLFKTINTAKHLIEEQLKPNLAAGQEIGQIRTKVYSLNELVNELLKDMREAGTQQTSPSMLSAEFYDHFNGTNLTRGWQSTRIFLYYQWTYFKQNLGSVLLALFFIALITFGIRSSQSLTKQSSKWHPFTQKPLASAIFIFGFVIAVINNFAVSLTLPPDWGALLKLPLILSVILLSDIVCKTPWQSQLLKQLLVFLAVTLLITTVSPPQILLYLFVFYVSVLLFAYYLIRFIKHWLSPSRTKFTWALLLWGVFPLIIIIAGLSGFDQFAVVLFSRTLALVALSFSILLLMQLISGLLELFLQMAPVKIIRQNAATIVKEITPVLILLHGLFWLAATLNILWLYPTLNGAFSAITSLQFSFSSFTITPGSILTVFFTIYATFLFSRGLRAFLMQEVLPRYKVERGVQISISRLIHYAVLSIGFVILLSLLGFGLSQVTIIGGALGVGIGFGLQAIVNNFVSGLILLFEQPIKVGDIIEVGTEMGEIKELGLRATIVQTFDNAEIVVPNSELISGTVTNWTLANKKVRVRVPVGVAYGTDLSKVLSILLSCAEANPIVLATPKPVALFLAFGASSLDFELRVWISDFNDKLTVLSQLNQDIDEEFQRAGIEIPFPQSDLHLRSIDQEAAAQLTGSRTSSEKEA